MRESLCDRILQIPRFHQQRRLIRGRRDLINSELQSFSHLTHASTFSFWQFGFSRTPLHQFDHDQEARIVREPLVASILAGGYHHHQGGGVHALHGVKIPSSATFPRCTDMYARNSMYICM